MKTDFVFPFENNEMKFIKNAELLGYKQLFLIYQYDDKLNFKEIKDKIVELNKTTKLVLFVGLLANSKNMKKASKLTKFIFIDSRQETDITLRNIIEKYEPFMIFNLEYQKRDFIHHKNSGLNQITSLFLFKNKIKIGYSFSLIIHTNMRQFIFGRMMQNIRLARKFGFKTNIASFANNQKDMRSSEDLKSLFINLGMHPKEANDSFHL